MHKEKNVSQGKLVNKFDKIYSIMAIVQVGRFAS